MRLPDANRAVQEQRVELSRWRVAHLSSGRKRQLVARTADEVVEIGEAAASARVESSVDLTDLDAIAEAGATLRFEESGSRG